MSLEQKIKYIKLKKPLEAQIVLQNWIINKKISNAGLISLQLHCLIRKFIKEVQQIPLSDELQPALRKK